MKKIRSTVKDCRVFKNGDELSNYELEYNIRKKEFHDALERTLIAANFPEATTLKFVFSGEASNMMEGEVVPSKKQQVQRRCLGVVQKM